MSTCDSCGCHLKPWALGLAIGIIWGLCVLIMGLLVSYEAVDTTIITSTNVYFMQMAPTVKGSLIAGLLAFVHGFIKGLLIAWLYNMFARCCTSCRKPGEIEVTVEK